MRERSERQLFSAAVHDGSHGRQAGCRYYAAARGLIAGQHLHLASNQQAVGAGEEGKSGGRGGD